MVSDIWLRTILIVRKETRCRHIGYSFRLTARVLPTDRVAHTMTFVTPVVEHWLGREIAQWVHPMKDRSDESANETGAYTTGPHFVAILHSGFDPSITTLPRYIVLNRFSATTAMQLIVDHKLFMINEFQMLHRSSSHVQSFTRGSFHKVILALHSFIVSRYYNDLNRFPTTDSLFHEKTIPYGHRRLTLKTYSR